MRFPIAWRLGLVLVMVGLLGTGLTGYFAYQASREQLVNASEARLQTATHVLMRQVTVALNDVKADVRLIAQHPQAARILQRSTPGFQALSEENVAKLFEGLMLVHPEYFQIRLIESANHGLERIRIDRGMGGLLRISGDDLQEKAHYQYVFETLQLPPEGIYVSRAFINHETGAHAGEGRPALQVAAPIRDTRQRVIGLIVINVDLQGLFAQLAADLPPELKLYLANRRGDYLIHPDPSRSFAFDRGQEARVQDEFPAIAALLNERPNKEVHLVTTNLASAPEALVAAFDQRRILGMEGGDGFILGLSQPLASVLSDSKQLASITLGIVLSFSALTILLAIFLARAFNRPLYRIVEEIRNFAVDGKVGRLPLDRKDEIGELAHSIMQMEKQINHQIEDLQRQQEMLDHLASHDSLTGLPNRRMFLDRLEHALARAKRQNEQLLLLFIDLDNFKIINDTHGHAAGDAVLQAVAQRLHDLLRESDTAARLGGDEFIIMLEGTWDDAQIEQMVLKVKTALAAPIPYRDIELHSGGSIGFSRFPQDGSTSSTLVAAADQAMYHCKTARR
ncbi:MAG: diguanylate cyclase [Gammaproteobacteria bacterium]|nr:diguanylate cyclase [Gammaproteobacteria bacterium]MBU1624399.1 diguanylate cyclase [Gammaproteobacteria bacterium]MBU1981127.1 diguanylate cyclase [Gammaproteobacteria bacterium]